MEGLGGAGGLGEGLHELLDVEGAGVGGVVIVGIAVTISVCVAIVVVSLLVVFEVGTRGRIISVITFILRIVRPIPGIVGLVFADPGPIILPGLRPTPLMMLPTPPHPLIDHLFHIALPRPPINPIPLNNKILPNQPSPLINKVGIFGDNGPLLYF